MSDEYGRNGFKDSLVDDSINPEGNTFDERTRNYPPKNDTTSSGGFSTTPDMWSNKAQRGNNVEVSSTGSTGLIDQSTNGSNLKNQMEDAKQGRD